MAAAKGRFITFEGGEGAGKTTQTRLLADQLQQKGLSVVLTREPGGSEGAEAIRALLVTGDKDRWSSVCEALLMYAARADHWQKCIQPALERGQWVICDRFADSTLAYQGYGHGVDPAFLQTLYQQTVGGCQPDRTYIFDASPDLGLQRARKRLTKTGQNENRFESFDHDFHQRVYQGFLEIARNNGQRCRIIQAKASIPSIQETIWQDIQTEFLK